ncbi:hypothetical protein E2C01_032173 [Portunus trituberculatus]|uniref:Uncharacterized protein n=1 Tax=Portunus trituberculatus TaxID=210409 RepID=A0A5B7EWU2_PORTR|nr:hypothetical protein [Portunus trituberculatus]
MSQPTAAATAVSSSKVQHEYDTQTAPLLMNPTSAHALNSSDSRCPSSFGFHVAATQLRKESHSTSRAEGGTLRGESRETPCNGSSKLAKLEGKSQFAADKIDLRRPY